MIPQAVVDVQIEVEASARDAIEVGRLEMFDLGQAAKWRRQYPPVVSGL